MRRRAAFYFLLGLTTALLIVALATGLQTGGSRDPNAWMWAHRHLPLLQMLDLAAVFIFVVISIFGLAVSRLQVQLQHQSEDYGDQMQTLLHRNDELAKVNDEYAEQIAALETGGIESPALLMGDSSQRVLSALHWQVDAQAQQLEAVHRALEQQHDALQELRQHVDTRGENSVRSLTGSADSPWLSEASPPRREEEDAQQETEPNRERGGFIDCTVNDGSTLIGEMLEFDVGAFVSPPTSAQNGPQAVQLADVRTYPVDSSLLSVVAGHLSSMPDASPAPPQEPERVAITVTAAPPAPPSLESPDDALSLPPRRTQGALALDMAETALSSLQSQTQDALSLLRAQVEAATAPPETDAPVLENVGEPPQQPARRRPWHLRF